ncbi:hypothetical protein [Sphingomonas sp. RS2018]
MEIGRVTAVAVAVMVWAALMMARGTPVGRLLEDWLVVAPGRWLGRLSRGHVFIAIGLVVFVALVLAIFEMEGVQLLSMASPEILSVLATAEIATYVDLIVMGTIAASTTRLRPLVARLRGIVRRPRRARRSRPAQTRPTANDDDRPGHYALAA